MQADRGTYQLEIRLKQWARGNVLRFISILGLAVNASILPVAGESSDVAPTLSPSEAGYSVEHWTVEEGLPGRIITSLAQTPDGALWCGSSEGLARFDGAHFTRFDLQQVRALQGMRIIELRCDRKGRLWIAGVEGELAVFEENHFRRLNDADGIPSLQAGKLGEVRDEDFWLKGRTNDHFYHYQDGRFETVTCADAPGSSIDRFVGDSTGLCWGVHELNRVMIQFLGQKTEAQPLLAPDGKTPARAGRLFRLQDGRWAVTSTHGIYVLNDVHWKLLQEFTHPIDGAILDGLQDWNGNYWVSVFDLGLFLTGPHHSTSRIALPDLDPRPFLRTMLMGKEGNVWIGGNDGLYRLRRLPFQPQPPHSDNHKESESALVEARDDSVWILHHQGWTRSTKRGWEEISHPYPLGYLWTGCASRDGSMLLGYTENGDSDRGFLDKVMPDGHSVRLGEMKGIIRVILESRAAEVWVGTESGLWRWNEGRFTKVLVPAMARDLPVRGMAEDEPGGLVVAVYGQGLWRRNRQGEWQRLTTGADLSSREIWGITVDTNGVTWAATDSGLARWREGKWCFYGTMNGELPRLARSVVRDDLNGLWIASQFGLARVSLETLNRSASGEDVILDSDWFDGSDGLPSVSSADEQGNLLKTKDGRVWIATLKGAAVVNPAEWQIWRRRLGAPSVKIQEILADDTSLLQPGVPGGPSEGTEIPIRPGARRVEFRYDVVDLTPGQKARLRYRLGGFDQKWVNAGEQRRAVYHHLPPGNYRFEVMAANKYGLWATQLDSATIWMKPHYWQTLWFKISVGLFLLGTMWLSRSVTLRRLHREQKRREVFSLRLIESQEAERKRIAQELHDSLGQDLILIKNAAKLSLRKFNPEEPVRAQLSEMAELASHALSNARVITGNLRPPELDRLGLTAALESMVEKCATHSEIQLSAKIENVNGLWFPAQEIHVYRLVQENLNNALKHAHSRHIEISVQNLEHEVNLRIADDGCGFDPEKFVSRGSGMGLPGLRERVRILGGVMELISRPGEGTIFRCRIPVSIYGKKREN